MQNLFSICTSIDSLIQKGYEDFLRHKADRAINTAKVSTCQVKFPDLLSLTSTCLCSVQHSLLIWVQVKVLKEGKVVSVQSQEIKVDSYLINMIVMWCEGWRHCDGDEGGAVPSWSCSPRFLIQVNPTNVISLCNGASQRSNPNLQSSFTYLLTLLKYNNALL